MAIIERVQPYHRRNGGRYSPLWLLHELNNADKHRLIQFVMTVHRGMSLLVPRKEGGPQSDFHIHEIRSLGKGKPLVHGAKVGEIRFSGTPPAEMDMQTPLSPDVVFWEGCPAVHGLGVIPLAKRMVEECVEIIRVCASEFPPRDA